MTNPPSFNQLEALLPVLRQVAELVAQKREVPSREELYPLLKSNGLDEEEWAVGKLEHWADVLTYVCGVKDARTRDIAVHSLMFGNVPEAPARLAVEMVAPAPPKPKTLPIQVSREAIGFGELNPGEMAQTTLTVSGGPGRVKVGSDMVTVNPQTFGPAETTLTVAVKAGLSGQVFWDALILESETESIKVDLTARWAVSPKVVSEPAVVTPSPRPTPLAQPLEPTAGQERVNPIDGAVMVYIPEGEFIMGTSEKQIAALLKQFPSWKREWFDREKPQRTVYLDGYWIYKYEVTVAQYRKFCQDTGWQMPKAPRWGWQDDHPIVKVTWNDAKAYCDWAGVQLPTEAQWEKAARSIDGRIYPWGNEWDASKCNNYNAGQNQTTPVGSYPAGVSPYGLMDMAGNVWEWCADWFDEKYYASAPDRNPTGPASGIYRVLRGGSWRGDGPVNFRAALRLRLLTVFRLLDWGFRCASLRFPR